MSIVEAFKHDFFQKHIIPVLVKSNRIVVVHDHPSQPCPGPVASVNSSKHLHRKPYANAKMNM